jgi:peptide/nickel transport system permease protein/glutathione transport system permease protein
VSAVPELIDLGRGARQRRRLPFLTSLAAAVALVIVVCLVFGSAVAPQDPEHQDLIIGAATRSGSHWLGTDELGRDVFSRLVAGTGAALVGPLVVALLTLSIGSTLGACAGYFAGRIDAVIARAADLIWSMPALLVAVVIIGVVHGGYWLAAFVIAFLSLPHSIRLARSATRVQARLPYIDAARSLGLRHAAILWRHVLPNILPTLLATCLLDFVGALIGFSALAFLGVGVQPGSSDWGTMLAAGQQLISINPWMLFGPAFAIVLTAGSVTILGDWAYERLSETDR